MNKLGNNKVLDLTLEEISVASGSRAAQKVQELTLLLLIEGGGGANKNIFINLRGQTLELCYKVEEDKHRNFQNYPHSGNFYGLG